MNALFPIEYFYAKEPVKSALSLRYDVRIVSALTSAGGNVQIVRQWEELRFEQVSKYTWFFRRVAALYQLEYPRLFVGFHISRHENISDGRTLEIKQLKDKIISAKAKITQANNELNQLRAGWKELFPVEQHPKYAATMAKLLEKQSQLAMMENQLSEKKQQPCP